MKTSISDFVFIFSGFGHYIVRYTSPVTYKKWSKTVNNMPLIDETKNAYQPTQKALNQLKRLIKS
jgi:hypothetical protein